MTSLKGMKMEAVAMISSLQVTNVCIFCCLSRGNVEPRTHGEDGCPFMTGYAGYMRLYVAFLSLQERNVHICMLCLLPNSISSHDHLMPQLWCCAELFVFGYAYVWAAYFMYKTQQGRSHFEDVFGFSVDAFEDIDHYAQWLSVSQPLPTTDPKQGDDNLLRFHFVAHAFFALLMHPAEITEALIFPGE